MKSYWLDQRDIPDSKWGKDKLPGCICGSGYTCRVCLDRTTARNQAEEFVGLEKVQGVANDRS